MLPKIKTITDIMRTVRSGENVGDVAILKLTLFNEEEGENQYTDAVRALKELNFQPLNLDNLADMPKESLGQTYLQFMHRYDLRPFNFSSRVYDLFDRFPVSIRYARIHDLVHTLLGFEADLQGELGVYAFVNQQRYTRFLTKAYKTGRVVTRVLKPWALSRFKEAERRGAALSEGARPLIIERLEEHLSRPLVDVRRELVPAYEMTIGREIF